MSTSVDIIPSELIHEISSYLIFRDLIRYSHVNRNLYFYLIQEKKARINKIPWRLSVEYAFIKEMVAYVNIRIKVGWFTSQSGLVPEVSYGRIHYPKLNHRKIVLTGFGNIDLLSSSIIYVKIDKDNVKGLYPSIITLQKDSSYREIISDRGSFDPIDDYVDIDSEWVSPSNICIKNSTFTTFKSLDKSVVDARWIKMRKNNKIYKYYPYPYNSPMEY